jgi:calcineurin-like phosphoesterase family protein/purple acid phosphatase-like protein
MMQKTAPRLATAAMLLVLGARVSPAVTVTRGPYLQTPTSSSMIVRWRTDTLTSSRVLYGAAPGSLGSNLDDVIPTTEHIVTVSGLAADTQYYYAVGSVAGALVGDDADHYFRTAPTAGTAKPLRFWAIGDAGFTGAALDSVRDAFATFNGSSAADLFLLLGDNAYLLATDAQYQAAVFDEHAAMLRTTPVYSVFGNHEAFSSNSVTQLGPYFDMFSFPSSGQAGGVASGTEAYYSFDYANIHFIVLDSEQPPTSSSTPMLTWLVSDLQSTTADWVIAMWHRPPYSKGLLHDSDSEANEIDMRQYANPILESYGVDLVLSGHSHSYERSYFIDNHYGPSSTFSDANKVDPGDGDPAGDGAYRKSDLGPTPHSGAVFVVDGSGSEVRNTTLNHPAMIVGLLELGSLVVDVDGDTLTARMLNSSAQVRDTFRIVKGTTCPATPATGCAAGAKGRLSVTNNANDAKDRWGWTWRAGTIDASGVGTPSDQTDLAACVYDADGVLVGGSVLHGASAWVARTKGLRYYDLTYARHGFRKIRIRYGTGSGSIVVKAQGASAGVPAGQATSPFTAQLVNLDSGACWESVFATPKRNDPGKIRAAVP